MAWRISVLDAGVLAVAQLEPANLAGNDPGRGAGQYAVTGRPSTSVKLGARWAQTLDEKDVDPAVVIVSVIRMVLTIFGYRLIHRVDHWISLITCGISVPEHPVVQEQ